MPKAILAVEHEDNVGYGATGVQAGVTLDLAADLKVNVIQMLNVYDQEFVVVIGKDTK